MHITAKTDYAVRTMLELAAAGSGTGENAPRKAEALAAAQHIPHKFLEATMLDLRRAGLVNSRRGPDGGYWLARCASDISVADVIRAVEGPLASVRGMRPEDVEYEGPAEQLQRVWLAVRVNMRAVLEDVSLEAVAQGTLPEFVAELLSDPGAWKRR